MSVISPDQNPAVRFRVADLCLNTALAWLLFALGLRFVGYFTAWTAGFMLLPSALISYLLAGQAVIPVANRFKSWIQGFIFIAVFAPIYLSSPGEFFSGRWDPGVYLAQGFAATQYPGLTIPDSASAVLDPNMKALLYGQQRGLLAKHAGFYLAELHADQLRPQFLPLYPTALAAAFQIGGLETALRLDGLFYLLSALLLGRSAARFSRSRWTFLVAAIFFAAHPACIWFGRFHTCEAMSLFLFCVLLSASSGLSLEPARRDYQFQYALASFLLPWSTVAAVPVAIATVVFAFVLRLPRRSRLLLGSCGVAGLATALIHLFATGNSYGRYIRGILPAWDGFLHRFSHIPLLPLAMGIVVVALALAVRSSARMREFLRNPAGMIGLTLILFAAGALAHARWSINTQAVLALVSPVFVAWAIVGAWRIWKEFRDARAWLVWVSAAAGLVTVIFWLWSLMPDLYPWAWKRWIWALPPALALWAAIGLAPREREPRAPRMARWICIALVIAMPLVAHGALTRGGEWRGFHEWLRQVALTLPEGAIVLAPDQIGTPLEFIHGKLTIPFSAKLGARERVALMRLVDRTSDDRPIVILAKAPPALAGISYRELRLPVYTGDWIQQIEQPGPFHRQPRGYDLNAWVVIRNAKPQGEP